eukprot:15434002-Alexandrium_andersonii.AAC.1
MVRSGEMTGRPRLLGGRHCVFGPNDGTGCACWARGRGAIVLSGHMAGKGCVCVEGGSGMIKTDHRAIL